MKYLPPALEQLLDRPPEERRIGPFLLIRQLGSGGFAPVWLARESYAGEKIRDVALKLFALSAGSTASRARWIREARALCRVEHSNIVRFYSLVLDEAAGVGGLAMEYLKGLSLGRRLEAGGLLKPQEVMEVALAVAPALAQVHRAGLLHRDIKPDNIVEAQGFYKLIDFGIAALGETQSPSWDGSEVSTQANSSGDTAYIQHGPSGTLGYIAPECLRGAPPSPASDLYALGATLYACLTGYPPASRPDSLGEKYRFDPALLDGTKSPRLYGKFAETTPQALAKLIESMLSPQQEKRPPSAQWVAERLWEYPSATAKRTSWAPVWSKVSPPPVPLRPWLGIAAVGLGAFTWIFWPRAQEEPPYPLAQAPHHLSRKVALAPAGDTKKPKAQESALSGIYAAEKASKPKRKQVSTPGQAMGPAKPSPSLSAQESALKPESPFEVIKEF